MIRTPSLPSVSSLPRDPELRSRCGPFTDHRSEDLPGATPGLLFPVLVAVSVECQGNVFLLRLYTSLHFTLPCWKTRWTFRNSVYDSFPHPAIGSVMETNLRGPCQAGKDYPERDQVAPCSLRVGWSCCLLGLGLRSLSFSECLQACRDREQ